MHNLSPVAHIPGLNAFHTLNLWATKLAICTSYTKGRTKQRKMVRWRLGKNFSDFEYKGTISDNVSSKKSEI